MKEQCRGYQMRLTPRDVFLIAYQLQITTTIFVERYCQIKESESFPIVLMNEDCVCFKNDQCILTKKPDACIFQNGNAPWFEKSDDKVNRSQISDDVFYSKWMQAFPICSLLIEKKESQAERLDASKLAIHYLYKCYNNREPFLKQFDKNVLEFIGKVS